MISTALSRRPWGFDMRLEVLASIPLAAPAPIKRLADDFNLTIRQIGHVFRQLQAAGHPVRVFDGEVVLGHQNRERSIVDAEIYWRRVHERPTRKGLPV